MANRFLSLPVLPPNLPGGGYVIGGKVGSVKPYPEGTQTHAYVIPGLVKAITPAPVNAEGVALPGCYLHVDGQPAAIFVYLSADEAHALIAGACAEVGPR